MKRLASLANMANLANLANMSHAFYGLDRLTRGLQQLHLDFSIEIMQTHLEIRFLLLLFCFALPV